MAKSNSPADTGTLSLALDLRPNNRGLFADNFLDRRLKDLPEWQEQPGIDGVFDAVLALYAKAAAGLPSANEWQTEHDFIQPVFDILWGEHDRGDSYQVQVTIPNLNGRRQPDYAFFRYAADRTAAEPLKGSIEFWHNAACLGDAKRWTALLDRDRAAGENPSAQIGNYLYRSRVRWGILTNGRQWRLYEREKSSAGGVFFEVDLLDVIRHKDREAFRWFYAFFRRAAFLPDAEGKSFVEKVFQGSVDYATKVGDRLKESVYDALRLLMNGFLAHPANGLDRQDPDHLKLVHENSLILLYRLLFLLYAEDKTLLPLEKGVYRDHSLKQMHAEINGRLREGREYFSKERRFWSKLSALFDLIDDGLDEDGRVVIPAYNGGLFTPAAHPHIAHTAVPGVRRWEIGDRFLAQAIDMLAYRRERWDVPGDQDIDYNSLEVQHLGSIYEGLLELQPRVADQPMVETVKDGRSVFKPEAEVPEPGKIRGQNPRRIAKDAVYLVTNRGERKATGSYYTPKYIVDYIVQNTVGPLTDEAARKVAALRPEVDRNLAEQQKALDEWETRARAESEHAPHVARRRKEMDTERRRLLAPYLELRILDPAMGSGHFLVGAADFLSLAMATDPGLIPLDEMGSEDEQSYYKRIVVERCLYGVDLNPLAVELAKLSLWLHTVSKNKALSFLDHHLRCGNSLIGATIDDLAAEPPRFNAAGKRLNGDGAQSVLGFTEVLTTRHLQSLLDTFREIMESPSGEVEWEREKARLYARMDEARARFRAVANCWLAPYFGAPVSAEQYSSAVNALRNDTDWPALQQQPWFAAAQQAAGQKRFFHWELEFPEQFFTPRGLKPAEERGFDAVIANPPYGVLLSGADRAFAQANYCSAGTVLDAFALFVERGGATLREQAYLGMITPSGWLTAREHRPARTCILSHLSPSFIVHLPYDVFADAYIDCILFVAGKHPAGSADVCLVKRFGARERVTSISLSASDYSGVPVASWLSDEDRLMVTDAGPGQWLRRWSRSPKFVQAGSILRVTRGITPYIEADGEPERPSATGFFGSVGRYDLQIERFAAVVHDPALAEYRPKELFSGRRLIVRRIISRQRRIHATLVENDFVISKSYLVALPLPGSYSLTYCLALLNSSLLSSALVSMSEIAKRDDFPQLDIATASELPVPRIDFTTPERDRAALLDQFRALYDTSTDNDALLAFVAEQLSCSPERADVVHDALAFLAGDMIELNKRRQEETRGFLAWLRGNVLNTEIDELSGRTKMRDYHEHDFASLMDVLKSGQNRGKLKVDPHARAVQEMIEGEFNASVAKLAPIRDRIAATDELIDQIVYRLYGLTEEEIAIVEGGASPH